MKQCAKFATHVTSASEGAVTDKDLKLQNRSHLMKFNMQFLLRFILSVLALTLDVRVYAETNSVVSIRPAGIRVVAAGFDDERPRPFNYSSGMGIDLLVKATNSSIVNFDAKKSLVEKITDDKGTVLLQKQSSFTMNPDISADGKLAIISLNCSQPPTAGSKEITVSGFLMLETGKKLSVSEVKNAPLVEGALNATGLKLNLNKVGKTSWGKPGTKLNFRFTGPTAPKISSVVFLNEQGGQIPAQSSGFAGARYYFKNATDMDSIYRDMEFILPPETASATVRIEFWSETESRAVPFNFVTGIGL